VQRLLVELMLLPMLLWLVPTWELLLVPTWALLVPKWMLLTWALLMI
jgi:hypothetical protein